MNVLHLNASDKGGAANAALRFHENLSRAGFNSRMIVGWKETNNAGVIQYERPQLNLREKIYWKLKHSFFPSHPLVTDPRYHFYNVSEKENYIPAKRLLELAGFTPDLIVVYWISQFVNMRTISELSLKSGARVIWYPMDMSAFTGGCHYAWDCKGFTKACGCCPALYSSDPNDRSHQNLETKLKYSEKLNMVVIAPTEWLHRQVKQSRMLGNKRTEKLLLAVDTELFKPADRREKKKSLALPENKKVIFIGAHYITDERKGFTYLTEALKIVASQSPLLAEQTVILIAGKKGDMTAEIPFEHNFLGYVDKNETLVSAYQAADLFVCPSVEDSGPMMINEAIACGTPVASFEMGVAPDLVHTGKTGYRAKLKDSEDLAKGITEILNLNEEDYFKMRAECRKLAEEQLSYNAQSGGFMRIVNSLT